MKENLRPIALTIRDATTYSGLRPWALRTAIWAGRLPAKKAGRIILILTTDLENFVRALPPTGLNEAEWFARRQQHTARKAA